MAFDAPVCGLAAYEAQRHAFGGEWAEGATGRESAITLNGQTRAKEFEDRVLAMDKAGEGEGKRRRHGGG